MHKADPVLRLPLALGLAHLLAVASRAAGRVGSRVPTRFAGTVAIPVVAGLVAVTLLPAWGSGLAPQGAYAATPAYWQQAADWIDRHADGERTLLLPSANAPLYRWGTPRDEPLQALASAPWAVRDGAPLGAPGSTRLLDGLDARLATGEPSPAYADVLARAGIGFVLVRNDLDPERSGSERPAVIRAALAGSPGLTEVARFGPAQPPAFQPGDHRAGAAAPDPAAVEVFAVAGAERVTTYPDDGAVALSGGPEGVLSLADAGLLDGRAVMGTIDAAAADAADEDNAANTDGEPPSTLAEAGAGSDEDAVVQTDTQRRRAYNPGADPGRRYSATLSAADPLPRPDLGPYDAAEQAVSVLEGASNVTASSSADDPFAADPGGVAHRGPDRRPAAAVDGDPDTAWVSASGTVGQYLDLSLLHRTPAREVTVDLVTDPSVGPDVTSLAVTTDAGTGSAPVHRGEATVPLPPGSTTRIRVTITGVAGDPDSGAVGIRELRVPGVAVTEAIVLPPNENTIGEPWTVLAERPDGRRGDCLRGPAGWTCVPGLAEPGEESGSLERRFEAPAGDVAVAGTVRPRPGPGLDILLDEAIGYRADGTSRITADPAARPGAGYDGDPATAWLPAPGDQAPRLTLALGRTARITGLTGADWTGVAAVDLTTRTGERRTLTGPGSFRPVRTDQVTLTFRRAVRAGAGGADGGARVRPHRRAGPVGRTGPGGLRRRPGSGARRPGPQPVDHRAGRRPAHAGAGAGDDLRAADRGGQRSAPDVLDRDGGAGGGDRGGVQRAAAGGAAGPCVPHGVLVRPAPRRRRGRRRQGLPGDVRGLQRRLAGHRVRPDAEAGPDGRLAAGLEVAAGRRHPGHPHLRPGPDAARRAARRIGRGAARARARAGAGAPADPAAAGPAAAAARPVVAGRPGGRRRRPADRPGGAGLGRGGTGATAALVGRRRGRRARAGRRAARRRPGRPLGPGRGPGARRGRALRGHRRAGGLDAAGPPGRSPHR